MSEYKGYQANLFAKFADGTLASLVSARVAEGKASLSESDKQTIEKVNADLQAFTEKCLFDMQAILPDMSKVVALTSELAKAQAAASLAIENVESKPMATAFENFLKDLDLKVIGESGGKASLTENTVYKCTSLKHDRFWLVTKAPDGVAHVTMYALDNGNRILVADFTSESKAYPTSPTAIQRVHVNLYTSKEVPENCKTLADRIVHLSKNGAWLTNTNGDADTSKLEIDAETWLNQHPVKEVVTPAKK